MKSRKPAEPRPVAREIPEAPLDPSSDEFACLVAALAWRDGLTANAIARELKLPADPRHLMQVKRGLKRAHNRFLRFDPPPHAKLAEDLSRVVNARREKKTRFYVVQDKWGPSFAGVYAKAAELVVQIITEAVRESEKAEEKDREVVVCNAGGRTISDMVKALQRNPPVLDESYQKARELTKYLKFVAANEAYQPAEFHRSANFLSVTMAELFEAGHWAVPRVLDADLRKRHQDLVDKSALLICSAGTLERGLMRQYFDDHDWPVPPEAVGDLAFNFLDRGGSVVESPSPEARAFLSNVNPTLDGARLMHIAATSRVLLILDAAEPVTKREIAAAALRRAYATDVVVGERLAQAILDEYRAQKA
jgi:hypothetical protein